MEITPQQAAIDLGFDYTDNPETETPPSQPETADDGKKPCPDCGRMMTWLADGSRPRQHKCEPPAGYQPPGEETKEEEQPAQPAQQTNSRVTPEVVIAAYIKTRDEIAAKTRELEDELAVLKDLQSKRANWLKGQMDALGVTSFKTVHGTSFIDIKDSATVADNEAFLAWCHEDWEKRKYYIKKGVVKTLVKESLDAGQTPPPGIDYVTFKDVKVRRS